MSVTQPALPNGRFSYLRQRVEPVIIENGKVVRGLQAKALSAKMRSSQCQVLWLMDTGCGEDLAPEDVVDDIEKYLVKAEEEGLI